MSKPVGDIFTRMHHYLIKIFRNIDENMAVNETVLYFMFRIVYSILTNNTVYKVYFILVSC